MPIEAVGKVAQTITVDKIFITGFYVSTTIGNESITIMYSGGYYNADGIFIPVSNHQIVLSGDDFIRVASLTPDTSAGLFAALELILIDEVTKDATTVAEPKAFPVS